MNLGKTIKYYRLKQDMTQAELALGICSIPHLSKIENGVYDVNHNTAKQLLKKLNVDMKEEQAQYTQLKEALHSFIEAIQFIDMQEAKELAQFLHKREEMITRTSFLYTYHLYMLRYHLQNDDIINAKKQQQILSKNQSSLTYDETLLCAFFNSLLLMTEHRFSEAKQQLLDIRRKDHCTTHTPMQEIDFALSQCYTRLHEHEKAVIHARDALRIFKQTDNYIHTFQAQLLLATNYASMNMIEDAMRLFKTLLRHARLFNQQALYYKTHYHYGIVLKKMKCDQKSYQYLSECLKYFEKSSEVYCHCLLATAQVCARLSMNHDQITNMLHEVMALSEKHGFPHLNLQARYSLLHLKGSNRIDHFIENVMLPYFNEADHGPNLVPYAIELAESYQNKGHHEHANAILTQYVTKAKNKPVVHKRSSPSPT
ncbi:helix-turn-helix transcriptional regulator [Shouchella lonarensis]|uniref:Helix-turn-helix n=1 Tax=Shouchella lonarensis TaxID=1464122 RepID=A0A1G6N0Q0_9BACI|nr:helix-turn-helix transcriptional regulator [Shouchella lonarensis]SDC60796.1 Helix-turn-helix [Shouchella lonarensis]